MGSLYIIRMPSQFDHISIKWEIGGQTVTCRVSFISIRMEDVKITHQHCSSYRSNITQQLQVVKVRHLRYEECLTCHPSWSLIMTTVWWSQVTLVATHTRGNWTARTCRAPSQRAFMFEILLNYTKKNEAVKFTIQLQWWHVTDGNNFGSTKWSDKTC